MEAVKEALGPHHPDTLTVIANLANTYSDQGRWDEAEKLEVQVVFRSPVQSGLFSFFGYNQDCNWLQAILSVVGL